MGLGLVPEKRPHSNRPEMTCLLDTHFLLWILVSSRRLRQFPWLERYRPWGVSPVSLLEVQMLSETGRLRLKERDITKALANDLRFVIDEPALAALVQRSLELSWTRDPFDRLLAAHSLVRRIPFCSLDSVMLENHRLILPELRA